jgi:FKBP-type peptidyl-prolyl cis-trans isomerase FklB
MNRKFSTRLAVTALVSFMTAANAADNAELKTDPEKNGYSIGYSMGQSLSRQFVDVDAQSMARGLKDAMSGTPSALPEPDMQQRVMAVRQESATKILERNKKAGEAFLAKNKGEKGVKTTASGLQYKVVNAGKGKQPKPEDVVTVNYRGTLVDGTEFDSSYKRGQPATFPLTGVIPGWTEALQLMKEGAKYMIYLPPSLAYGERGAGPLIGPNSTLIFEVELLSIGAPAKK